MIILLFISGYLILYGIRHRHQYLIGTAGVTVLYCLLSFLAKVPALIAYAKVLSAANHIILALLLILFARMVVSDGDVKNE